jgi:transposase InsO family protein
MSSNKDKKAFTPAMETAMERFSIIAPLLKLPTEEVYHEITKIANEFGLSHRTIQRYYNSYKLSGLDGLIPLTNGRPGSRSIPPDILEAAIRARRENPKRSIPKIIRLLEFEGIIKKGSIKRSTLQEQMFKAGFGKTEMDYHLNTYGTGGQRFQRKERNSLWQSDAKHAIYINNQKTYLISFLDDCTRLCTHSEFYFSEATESIMDCFQKGIEKFGAPNEVYFDNGSPYRNRAIARCCGMLSIRKRHTKPYCAKSKGKIERYHQFVDGFLSEIKLEKVKTLEELNLKWRHYIEVFYQNETHSSLNPNTSPMQAWNADATQLNLIDKNKLFEAFLMVSPERRVNKSGYVNFDNKQYEADNLTAFVGRKVKIVWQPSNKNKVWVEIPGYHHLIVARPAVIEEWIKKKVDNSTNNPIILKTDKSRVCEASKKEYLKREQKRINTFGGLNINNLMNSTETNSQLNSETLETEQLGGNLPTMNIFTDSNGNRRDLQCSPLNPPSADSEGTEPSSLDNKEHKETKKRGISFKSFKEKGGK